MIDLTGKQFGEYKVLKFARRIHNAPFWLCLCSCGTQREVRQGHLISGHSKSCGCKRYSKMSERQTTHGNAIRGKISPEYSVWHSMKQRCYQPSHDAYKFYGARGIKVCKEWKYSFETFLKDMGSRPSMHHSIDRINPGGDYCKENCRWILKTDNSKRRHAHVDRRKKDF